MYTVYVLRDKNNILYKGLTTDLERRLKEHRSGNTRTTSLMNKESLTVVYIEEYDNLREARNREKYFKSSAGRRFLKDKCSGSSDG